MWLRQEACAVRGLDRLGETIENGKSEEGDFYRGKIFASRYFFAHELTKTKQQAELLSSLDATTLEMEERFF